MDFPPLARPFFAVLHTWKVKPLASSELCWMISLDHMCLYCVLSHHLELHQDSGLPRLAQEPVHMSMPVREPPMARMVARSVHRCGW